MNLLPSFVDHDTAFRENAYHCEIKFPDDYALPASASVEIWNENVPLELVFNATIVGKTIKVDMDVDTVRKLPSRFDYYIKMNGEYLLHSVVSLKMGSADNPVFSREVIIEQGNIKVVKINGLEYMVPLANINSPNANGVAGPAVVVAAGTGATLTKFLRISANTIGNLIDPYTSEIFTVTRYSTKPGGVAVVNADVDNILYFKDPDGVFYRRDIPDRMSVDSWAAAGDGVTSDNAAFSKMLKSGVTKLKLGREKSYIITSTLAFDGTEITATPGTFNPYASSWDIDTNGSTVSTSASFLRLVPKSVAFESVAPYFTSKKDSNKFTKIAGVTDNIKVGDTLDLHCNTVRLVAGSYFDGTLIRVVKVTSTEIHMSEPFYKAMDIHKITIYEGIYLNISGNGTVKMTGAGSFKGISAQSFSKVNISDLKVEGLPENQACIDCLAVDVLYQNCYTYGALDITGLASGGRLGYGYAAAGSNVTLINCRGGNHKHVFTCGNRNVMTLRIRAYGFYGFNPPENFASVVVVSGSGQPLHQGIFDVHANCIFASCENGVTEGCNAHYYIRNGHFILTNPTIYQYGALLSFGNQNAICIYEEPIRQINVYGGTYDADIFAGQTVTPCFMGIQSGLTGANQNIFVDGTTMNGGKVFSIEPTQAVAATANCSLKSGVFINLKGTALAGINIVGFDENTLLGDFGELVLHGNISLSTRLGAVDKMFHVRNVKSLKRAIGNDSTFDGRLYSAGPLVDLYFGGDSTPFEVMEFSNSEIHAGAGGFSVANTLRFVGRAKFDNSYLRYNYTGSNAFCPGIALAVHVNGTGVDVFSVRDMTFENQNLVSPATNFEAIRALARSKFDITGARFNSKIRVDDQSYFRAQAALGQVPVGVRSTVDLYYATGDGASIAAGKILKPTGFLALKSPSQTGAGTALATPLSIAADFTGQRLFNDSYAAGAPSYWVWSGTSWITEVDYSKLIMRASDIATNGDLDNYKQNGIFGINSQGVANTVAHLPVVLPGILEVYNLGLTNASTSCTQMWTVLATGATQGNRYSRICWTGTWTAWKLITMV